MTDIFLAANYIAIYANYSDPIPHKHWASHMIFGIDGPIECNVEQEKQICDGVFIAANSTHTINSFNQSSLIFLFDESSNIAKLLNEKYFKEKAYYVIDSKTQERVVQEWENANVPHSEKCRNIFQICGLSFPTVSKTDNRIRAVMNELNQLNSVDENIISHLASTVYLSESRLSHLFSNEMGISLASYLIMEKVKKTCKYVLMGNDLTTAAVKAGFSSSSHLSSVAKKMFGLTPSTLRSARIHFI